MFFLLKVVSFYVDHKDLGLVMSSPFAMKLEEQRRGREPDILFVGKERQHLFRNTYLEGGADVAIEIISPESVGRDRGEKFVEYEAAGIREYWLFDPQRRQAEFYRLNAEGRYQLVDISNGEFRSSVLSGFFLRVEWLWQSPLPILLAYKELNHTL